MIESRKKMVLVTGASSGIGKATALYLAEKGYSVIGTSRSLDRLNSLITEAELLAGTVEGIELDVDHDESIAVALKPVIDSNKRIDVLVNNAAYGLWGPAQSLSIDELRAQLETNFLGSFRMMKALLPDMIGRGCGKIINISSVEGRLVTPFNGGYAASKFALEGLSEAMRFELWPFGVKVVVVEPGLFKTNFKNNQVDAEEAGSLDSPYRQLLSQYRKKRRRYDILDKDPIGVAKVIHKIIKARRPRFRYRVGSEATLGILGASLLPERLFQALMSRAMLK
jgi:short-subunit dehydrogenase